MAYNQEALKHALSVLLTLEVTNRKEDSQS